MTTKTDPATKVMLPTELDEIMKRHAAAERGWHVERVDDDPYHLIIEGDGPTVIAHFGSDPDNSRASYPTEENAEFAAHAYWDVPRLVDEVRRLQAALNKGANSTDPIAILRLAVEQLRTNGAHTLHLLNEAEKERDEAQRALRWLRENALPTAQREAAYQKEGKERWRDRALKAETELAARQGAAS